MGSLTDSVQVTAELARLQTDSSEVSAALDNKSLMDLPLSFSGGRHAANFAFSIMPGVSGSDYTSHINGSTEFGKDVLLGEATTANQSGDDIASYVSLEALQEVKVQTSGLLRRVRPRAGRHLQSGHEVRYRSNPRQRFRRACAMRI